MILTEAFIDEIRIFEKLSEEGCVSLKFSLKSMRK